jgi:hypothetical protein
LEVYRQNGKKASDDYKKKHQKDLPKKPKFKVAGRGNKADITKLRGKELLTKLEEFLVEENTGVLTDISFNEMAHNIEEIKEYLLKCEKHIGQKHSQVFNVVVIYGKWLKKLHRDYYRQYETIVTETLRISVSWARKLRGISELFGTYSKLQNLKISVTVAASLVSKLQKAMTNHPEEAEKWK